MQREREAYFPTLSIKWGQSLATFLGFAMYDQRWELVMKGGRISISGESQKIAYQWGRPDNGLARPILGHEPVVGTKGSVSYGAGFRAPMCTHLDTPPASQTDSPEGDGLIWNHLFEDFWILVSCFISLSKSTSLSFFFPSFPPSFLFFHLPFPLPVSFSPSFSSFLYLFSTLSLLPSFFISTFPVSLSSSLSLSPFVAKLSSQ